MLTSNYLQVIRTLRATFTPTFAAGATIAASSFFWWRDGQYMHIDGAVVFAGVGSASPFTFSLPGVAAGNPVIDINLLTGGATTSNAAASFHGPGYWLDQGVAWKSVWGKFVSATLIGFWDVNQAFGCDEAKAGSGLNFKLSFPIVGW